jgi:hypothetical protein
MRARWANVLVGEVPSLCSGRTNGWRGASERVAGVNDRGGDRTRGLRIKSPLLYQLSYPVVLCGA